MPGGDGFWHPLPGGASALNDLSDVDTATSPPTDGQTLVYDDDLGLWVPGTVAGGGGGAESFKATTNMSSTSTGSYTTVFTTGSFVPGGSSVLVTVLGASSNSTTANTDFFRVTVNGVSYQLGALRASSVAGGQRAHGFGTKVTGLTAGASYTAAIGVKVTGGQWDCRPPSFPEYEQLVVHVLGL